MIRLLSLEVDVVGMIAGHVGIVDGRMKENLLPGDLPQVQIALLAYSNHYIESSDVRISLPSSHSFEGSTHDNKGHSHLPVNGLANEAYSSAFLTSTSNTRLCARQ